MPRNIKGWLLLLAGSTVVGLYFASQAALNPVVSGLFPWRKALAINLTYYYLWGLTVPAIVLLARRLPFDERQWRRAVLGHLIASVVATAVITVLAEAILKYVFWIRPGPLSELLAYAFGANFHSALPTYWMVLLAVLAFDFYVRMRDREVHASRLEARLSDARLDALKMQLRPHFLFNTLNSISTLIYEDPRAADTMVSRLAAFLRSTIDCDSRQLVPLSQELDFVQRYLEIEQVRFEDRLVVVYEVDAAVADVLVPTLILQPIVENAIHHAIARQRHGGRVTVAAQSLAEHLVLRVEDDGPGFPPGDAAEPRVGLRNTRARLEQLYGDRFSLYVDGAKPSGVAVEIRIPLQVDRTSFLKPVLSVNEGG